MDGVELLFVGFDFAMREAALFAACGFLLLGTNDLIVDWLWLVLVVSRRRGAACPSAIATNAAREPGLIAIFVPAWDEAAVIGDMLATALLRVGDAHCAIYVGCYPNDPATIAAVAERLDPRLRLVICPTPGPTTKADCLNTLWDRLVQDEAGIM